MEQWQSETISALMKAMNRAQLTMVPVKKEQENPFFHSKYADLGAVWEALHPFRAEGIVFTQAPMEGPPGCVTLDTQLTHAESGEWIRGRLILPLAKQDPQAAGSALSYGRRYSLSAMCGLVSEEDDDANAASHAPAKTYAQKFPTPVQHPLDSVEMHTQPDPYRRPAGAVWTVPNNNKFGANAGKPASELKDEVLGSLKLFFEKRIRDDQHSKYRDEWEEAVMVLEAEIAERKAGE